MSNSTNCRMQRKGSPNSELFPSPNSANSANATKIVKSEALSTSL